MLLTEGFLSWDCGGAYIWMGLYMEGLIFGILRYSLQLEIIATALFHWF